MSVENNETLKKRQSYALKDFVGQKNAFKFCSKCFKEPEASTGDTVYELSQSVFWQLDHLMDFQAVIWPHPPGPLGISV